MRKPESVKKRSTPSHPQESMPAWSATTASTARARMPSRAGSRCGAASELRLVGEMERLVTRESAQVSEGGALLEEDA